MIFQFLKIMKHNKTKNVLLLLQFSLSFVALYMLATRAVSIFTSYTTELGFETENLVGGAISGLYSIQTEEEFDSVYPFMKQAIEETRALPYIKQAGYLNIFPYGGSNNNSKGNKVNHVTPEALETLGLELTSGRLFRSSDQFEAIPEMVLLNDFAMEKYKTLRNVDNLLGKNLYWSWADDTTANIDRYSKIIGSFKDFRIHGRFRSFGNKGVVVFIVPFENVNYYKRYNENGVYMVRAFGRNNSFVARTDGSIPLTTAMKEINDIYKKYLPKRTTTVYSIPQLREDASKEPIKSFMILFFICIVLTFVIVLGVVAITKENISKRFKEIGIRMALGSTEKQVMQAFLSELLVLVLFASLVSGLSLYFLNLYHIASFTIGSVEYTTTFVLLLLVVIACVYKPIKNAAELKPNIALHYE